MKALTIQQPWASAIIYVKDRDDAQVRRTESLFRADYCQGTNGFMGF